MPLGGGSDRGGAVGSITCLARASSISVVVLSAIMPTAIAQRLFSPREPAMPAAVAQET
jgi:hypothetical protein